VTEPFSLGRGGVEAEVTVEKKLKIQEEVRWLKKSIYTS
jgi:hypothetical protein